MTEFTLDLVLDPTQNELHEVSAALAAYNRQAAIPPNAQALTILVRDADAHVVGGLRGETYWDWLFVDTLALRDEARDLGLGSRLLAMAEQEAITRGCHSAYLDTFSFQALPFYLKQGYEVFGTLENYPGEHTRYFLRKALVR